MTASKFVVSRSPLNIPNPLLMFGTGAVVIGTFLLFVGILGTWAYRPGLDLSDVDEFVLAMMSIVYLAAGVVMMFSGAKMLTPFVVDPNAPRDYSDLYETFGTLRSGEVQVYRRRESLNIRLLTAFFSDNIRYLTPVPRRVAERSASLLVNCLILSVAIILLRDVAIVRHLVTAYIILFLVTAAVLGLVLVRLLVPRRLPTSTRYCLEQDVHEGHPRKIYRSLRDGAREIGFDHANRFIGTDDFGFGGFGVQDTGTVSGYTFMESRPRPMDHQYIGAARFAMASGGAFLMVGVILSVFLNPVAYPPSPYGELWAMPLTSIVIISIGAGFLVSSYRLSYLLRFESRAIFTEISGEFYRSDLGAGTGTDDSIKSERLAVISDNRISYYAGEVLSECLSLHEGRDIIAINNTQQSRRDLQSLVSFMRIQRKPDLELHGVDFEQDSARKIIEQNLAISAIKSKQQPTLGTKERRERLDAQAPARKGPAQDTPRHEPPPTPVSLLDGEIPDDFDRGEEGDWGEPRPSPGQRGIPQGDGEGTFCPACGEPISRRARFCSECGEHVR